MFKKLVIGSFFLLLLQSPPLAFSKEYQTIHASSGTIHTIKLRNSLCGNIAFSTKVGHFNESHQCQYEKETMVHVYDGCEQYLNGGLLEQSVGKGYQCAATHARSVVFGTEILDEFVLISNNEGHYISSNPFFSEVECHGPW